MDKTDADKRFEDEPPPGLLPDGTLNIVKDEGEEEVIDAGGVKLHIHKEKARD